MLLKVDLLVSDLPAAGVGLLVPHTVTTVKKPIDLPTGNQLLACVGGARSSSAATVASAGENGWITKAQPWLTFQALPDYIQAALHATYLPGFASRQAAQAHPIVSVETSPGLEALHRTNASELYLRQPMVKRSNAQRTLANK